ncbi:MAG: response regulator [Gammaproteobacteria bacterium]|nr:response regulator [Gammaproteobacteria bacterium]
MTANIRVLVVDYDEKLRYSLVTFLKDEAFEATGVESGKAGLEILVSHPVDTAIVDMRLPDMDGNEWITHASRLYPGMHFLVYTGLVNYVVPKHLRTVLSNDQIFLKPAEDMSFLAEGIRRMVV